MTGDDAEVHVADLAQRFRQTRTLTEALAAPLSPEDQTIQSMEDASPTKWHRGHTTWFFETFLLDRFHPDYRPFHPGYSYIFNSYYEALGNRHPRAERGLVTRPGAADVASYRSHVDGQLEELFAECPAPGTELGEFLDLVELGIHHEQQHQELLLMDIKHALSKNPLLPAYTDPDDLADEASQVTARPRAASKLGWIEHPGGETSIGHAGRGFSFDNECPAHREVLEPFAIADRMVTNGEWLEFMEDAGYERPEFWLSDGWGAVRAEQWHAPLYWTSTEKDTWSIFTLGGSRPVTSSEPLCHVSLYEADAFARWRGYRLATESEWESLATPTFPDEHRFLDPTLLHPRSGTPGDPSFFGDAWEWTTSAYSPYPGFRPAAGAVGEYNGKFMVNQYVLRGGSCVTPAGHLRPTYRNFFPASARWVFSGVRLARDL